MNATDNKDFMQELEKETRANMPDFFEKIKLGGLVAITDRRYRRRKSTADVAVAAAGTATAR